MYKTQIESMQFDINSIKATIHMSVSHHFYCSDSSTHSPPEDYNKVKLSLWSPSDNFINILLQLHLDFLSTHFDGT